jgi:diguanylate cyclase (GGDEF)-like protein/PAS domain S-box-containing protein
LYTQQEVERIVKEVLPLLDCVGHWAGEAIALRRDGTTFDESLSLTRLPSGGLICVCRDITAGKRARRAAALLASVVEHSDDAIITKDLNGVVTSWNAAAQRLFGYQEQEMLGRPIQVLIPEDLMDEERRILERLRGGETISHYATKRRCKDGSLVDMSLTVSPIRDDDGKVIGASKIARDISAQKAMEAALYREKELAQVTLSSIGDAVITTDRDAKITYLNPIAQSMTGWSNDEAVGMPLPLVFRVIEASTGLPTRDPVLVALAQNRIVGLATDSLLINRHGAQTAVEDSAAPIHDRDGQIIGAVLIFRDVSETRAMALRMAHLAQHDALTDLPNRVLLRDRIEQSTALARRHQHRCALLFIDLDHFKLVNDSLGHSAADYILVEVGRRLREAVRESDTVSRQGGDEFVVLLGEVAHPNDAAHVATKILRSCAPPFMIDGQELIIGASVGIAVFPDDGPDVDALLRNADAAMYHAKQQGRNNFQFYSPGMNVRARERLTLKSELRRALSNGEFTLHYQPRVDVHTQAILGCEALIRWCHPDRGLVGPNEFIPAIEENGLIVPIGQWVMRAACRQLRDWRLAGASIVPVSINVSAAQFRRIDFYADLYQALVETHIEPQFLEIELTESTVMHDADATARVLHDLKNLGIRVSIDDFGTGYSSLSQLRRFPIDTLKIDQSFVQDLTTDPDDAAITGAIVNMAKSLRQQVVAEGVETIEQLNFLRALGCDQAQGYFFYRPLPAEAFSQLLLPRQRDASPTAS